MPRVPLIQQNHHQQHPYRYPKRRWSRYLVGCCFRCKWIWILSILCFQYALLNGGSNDVPPRYGVVPDNELHAQTGGMTPGQALHFITTYGIKTFARDLANVTSLEGWEQLACFVRNEQVGSFCLGWENRSQEASDLWWTHHPDWAVFNETEEGYCYRPHPDELQREYMASIYQHQFHHATGCSNVFVTRMWSSGWSADIYNLVHTLQHAMLHGQPMEITNNPWHYAAPDQAGRSNIVPSPPACPLLTMYCYFLPLSACPIQPQGTQSRDYDYLHPPRMPPRAQRWLPAYVARPQTWLRYKAFRFLQDQRKGAMTVTTTTATTGASSTIALPCTVLHVRRGDIVQHGNLSRRYHPLSEYLEVVDTTITTSRTIAVAADRPRIMLLTDDANVINERRLYDGQYHWMYLDRPRFHADQGGWEHQLPSSRPVFEMTVLWATFQWVKQCTSIVHSTSGFSNWLIWEMKQVHGENVKTYNLDRDVPREQLYGQHNIHSKNISTDSQYTQ
jgi:hypothetical protein